MSALQPSASAERDAHYSARQSTEEAAKSLPAASLLLKVLLLVAGPIAVAIGGAILFATDAFYAGYGLSLGDNISLLNEVRAPAGVLVASGLVVAAGAFVTRLTFTSGLLATLLYLSYGSARLLSMAMDGLPERGLVQATWFEILLGLALAFVMVRTYGRGASH